MVAAKPLVPIDLPFVREVVDDFLAQKRIALVGLSTDGRHFSRMVCDVLRQHDYDIVPVNPGAKEIEGMRCYAQVGNIQPPVDGALIMTTAERSAAVVAECHRAGIMRVWLHRGVGRGAASQEAIAFGEKHSMRVVPGMCPLMFVGNPPDAVHRMHALGKRVAGTYPTRRPHRLAAPLLIYPAVGWALCGAVMYLSMRWLSLNQALLIHALAAPVIFGGLAIRYYRRRVTPSPLFSAGVFTLVTIVLDLLVVALVIEKSLAMFASLLGTWIPFALIFLSSWLVGTGQYRQTMRRAHRRHEAAGPPEPLPL